MKDVKKVDKVIDRLETYEVCPLCGLELNPDDHYELVHEHVFYQCEVKPLLYLPGKPDRLADQVYKDSDGDLWVLHVSQDYDLGKPVRFFPTEAHVVAGLIQVHVETLAHQIKRWRETLKILEKGEK